MTSPSQLQARIIQAQALHDMYLVLCERLPREDAIECVAKACSRQARQAGLAFARKAPQAPCLRHFATILEIWSKGGALEIVNVKLEENCLRFQVRACGYVREYERMGIPRELHSALSCGRDEPFAKAYSTKLAMRRTSTIAAGAPRCAFEFTWNES